MGASGPVRRALLATVALVVVAAGGRPAQAGDRAPRLPTVYAQQAAPVPPATATPRWTTFTASVDTRKIYVDATLGDDATAQDDDASHPYQTLPAAAARLRNGYPDWLLLKRGETWDAQRLAIGSTGGRSIAEPMLISTYGSGARPYLTDCKIQTAYNSTKSFIAIEGLHMARTGGRSAQYTLPSTGSAENCLQFLHAGTGLLIENCRIEFGGSGVQATSPAGRLSGVTIRGCVFVDQFGRDVHQGEIRSQGLYLESLDGAVIEDCFFDHCGWSETESDANRSIFNHSIYVFADVTGFVCRRNVFCRDSSGAKFECGGVLEDNLFLSSPYGFSYGSAGVGTGFPSPYGGAVRRNVVLDSVDLAPDDDGGSVPYGRGAFLYNLADTAISENVFADPDAAAGEGSSYPVGLSIVGHLADQSAIADPFAGCTIRDNVFYGWETASLGGTPLHLDAVTYDETFAIEDNQFDGAYGHLVEANGDPAGIAWSGNRYYMTKAEPWFDDETSLVGYDDWVTATGETGSSKSADSYSDPGRGIGDYMTSIGETATLLEFVTLWRAQERGSWDPRLAASAVNDHVRAGYDIPAADVIVQLDRGTEHQTMTGWEAASQAGTYDEYSMIAIYDNWIDDLLDSCVDDLGIDRVRMEIRSGLENPVDYFSQYAAGTITKSAWRDHWYDTVPSGPPTVYQWSELEYKIDTVITPLRDRLAANGESLYVNLCFVDFEKTYDSNPNYHAANPDEYADLMLAAFQWMDTTYGWVPDGIEVILEADLAKWGKVATADCIVAAGDRLAAAGYHPDFIAPSVAQAAGSGTGNYTGAIDYFNTIAATDGALDYLTELSYHRYDSPSTAAITAIGSLAVAQGIKTEMGEYWSSGACVDQLHEDLELGMVSCHQHGTLGYPNAAATSSDCHSIDTTTYAVTMNNRARWFSMYSRWVRRGAVRFGTLSSDDDFDALAWENENGTNVVVVKAAAGGTIDIVDLPAGEYGIRYSLGNTALAAAPTTFDAALPDQTIAAGQTLSTAIPAAGVITIHGKTPTPSDLAILSAADLPDATTTRSQTYAFAATGGTAPYTWAVTQGTLPVSGTLVASTGVLAGTAAAPGTYVFTIGVTDADGATVSREFTGVVNDLLRFPAGLGLVRCPLGVSPMLASRFLALSGARFVASWSGGILETRLATGAGTDFTLLPGRVYFIDSLQSGEVVLDGGGEPSGPVIALATGFNFVGVPATLPATRSAAQIVAQIETDGGLVRAVHFWRDGAFLPFLPGRGVNDLDVQAGDAIVIDCVQACDWEPR